MKKFMFSAIAMIAFVGSSMASDNAVKEALIISDSSAGAELTAAEMDCRAMQAATVKHAKEVQRMSDRDANTAGYIVFF